MSWLWRLEPGGTADVVRHLASQKACQIFLEILARGKLGLASAYVHGFGWGLARDCDFLKKWIEQVIPSPRR